VSCFVANAIPQNSSQGIIVWGNWMGSLVVVTTVGVGFVMGSGEVVDWVGLCWTTVGTILAAASANAFNQEIFL
jgi:4-hydroxybenzoate polyprenyltransferase